VLHNPNAASGKGAIAKFHIKRDATWTIVTTDGSLSSQSEHTVLATRSGCEILTLGPAS
jgi:methionine aminopeptidase